MEGGILYFRDYKQANRYVTTIKRADNYIVSEYKQGGDIILDLENEQ